MIAVILFHSFKEYFPLGYLGVDVFFVISGYVITPLIIDIFCDPITRKFQVSSLMYFYKSRCYRLLPALSVTLTIFSLTVLLFGNIDDHKKISSQVIATLFLIGNFGAYKYSGDYFSPNSNPLIHTWSLAIESQIYFLLPLGIFTIYKISTRKPNILWIYMILTLVSFTLFIFDNLNKPLFEIFGINNFSQMSFYSPVSRFWQFGIGGIIYFLFKKKSLLINTKNISYQIITMVLLFLVLFSRSSFDFKLSTFTATFLAVLVIMLESLKILPKKLSVLLEWFGDRSYSIYLVHMPIIYLINASPIDLNNSKFFTLISMLTALIITIYLGHISYSRIENVYRMGAPNLIEKRGNFKLKVSYLFVIPIALSFVIITFIVSRYPIDPGLPKVNIQSLNWDKDCEIIDSRKYAPCIYGNNGLKNIILLIGDSHAASISQNIAQLSEKYQSRIIVFTRSGCGLFFEKAETINNYLFPYITTECIEHNSKILEIINEVKPSAVLLYYRSSSKYVLPNTIQSRAYYREQSLINFKKLSQFQENMLLIGPTPEYLPISSWVEKMLSKKGKFSSVPLEDSNYWEQNIPEEINYLNSYDILCVHNKCMNNSSGMWLFRDSTHLSFYGASRLILNLNTTVVSILSDKRTQIND